MSIYQKYNLNKKIFNLKMASNDRIKPLEEKFDLLEETLAFRKSLSPEENQALDNYKTDTSHFYAVINGYLLGRIPIDKTITERDLSYAFNKSVGGTIDNLFNNITEIYNVQVEKAKTSIDYIDLVFTKKDVPRLTGSEKVYRGMAIDNNTEFLKKIIVGDELVFDNYSSGSLSKAKASEFTYNNYCCLFVMKNLKNVPYMILDYQNYMTKNFENSIMYDEFEIFMPRGIRFKITNIEEIESDDIRRLTKKFKYMTTGQMFEMYEKDKGNFKKMLKNIDKIRMVTLEPIDKF